MKGSLVHQTSKRVSTAVTAFGLWLVTAALGLWEIIVVRDMVLRIYARAVSPTSTASAPSFWNPSTYGDSYWTGAALGNWVVFLMAVLWIVVAVGFGEYHYRHAGQPRSWRLFSWTIGIELFILVLAFLI